MLASDRIRALLAGDAPTPAIDGAEVDFARYSLVGGPANLLGVDATYVRDGEEVVALVTLGAALEGPPGRAHGGLVSAVVDETMTAMLTELGVVTFTASLSLDYRRPTPLHTLWSSGPDSKNAKDGD